MPVFHQSEPGVGAVGRSTSVCNCQSQTEVLAEVERSLVADISYDTFRVQRMINLFFLSELYFLVKPHGTLFIIFARETLRM